MNRMLWVGIVGLLCQGVFSLAAAGENNAVEVVYDKSETAMIVAWMQNQWPIDQTYPNGDHFDAVHRRLLVRFPGLADELHAMLRRGYEIKRAELVLDWAKQDVERPSGGYVSQGRAQEVYRNDPGQWSVVGWALRRPWNAHTHHGPTWNAFINGAGYWRRHGASDEHHDRYPTQFGPQPLHEQQATARLDITETLVDAAYGDTPAQRLRNLEQQGFILRKYETWEPKYGEIGSAYDWLVATGGHAIYIKEPRLVLQLEAKPGAEPGQLPPPVNIAFLAEELTANDEGGVPPTWIPAEGIEADLAARYLAKPEDMPDWQWQRVLEVRPLGKPRATRPQTLKDFIDICNGMLCRPPRWYLGAGAQDWILFQLRYDDLMPPHVKDHLANWWEAWLLPEYKDEQLVHPQGDDELRLKYGRASFYRGYTRRVSTVGFNHRSTEGALFGGTFIGAKNALEDARYGLENLPLRFWVFRDGTMQDMISGHYTALHVSFQAMFALHGPELQDRMMGHSMLDNTLELVASAYHPALRRIVYSGNRAFPDQIFLTQEGLYYILHTLSRQGALIHMNEETDSLHGMSIFGSHYPGDRVARMSPLQPDYVTNIVDDKPLPYRITAGESVRGMFTNPPLMQRVYLGRNYGLASQDLSHGQIPVIGQWRRKNEVVGTMQELGSLVAKYDVNRNLLPMPGGVYGERTKAEGALVNLQHDNIVMIFSTPGRRAQIMNVAGDDGLRSLQTTVGVYSFQEEPEWQIYVDDRPLRQFPAEARIGQRITIRDGITYIGIIPIPSTDLGRSKEIVIDYTFPCLQISHYNMLRDQAIDADAADWEAIDNASGGFIVELGDIAEYGSFEKFQAHIKSARLDTRWSDSVMHLAYTSGANKLEMGVQTNFQPFAQHYPIAPGTAGQVVPYRRVNGEWPYMPDGIWRDTTLSIQGSNGRLEKNGAVLTSTPGQMAYLVTEPISHTTVAYSPLPDPNAFELETPEGVIVKADGRLGMARVQVEPAAKRIEIDYVAKTLQTQEMEKGEQVYQFTGGSGHGARRVDDPDASGGIAQMRDLAADPGTYPFIGRSYIGPIEPGKYLARFHVKWEPLEENPLAAWRMRVQTIADDKEVAVQLHRGQGPDAYKLKEPGKYNYYDIPFEITERQQIVASIWPSGENGKQRLYADHLLIEPVHAADDGETAENAEAAADPNALAKRLLVFGLDGAPTVLLNSQTLDNISPVQVEGRQAYAIPLE